MGRLQIPDWLGEKGMAPILELSSPIMPYTLMAWPVASVGRMSTMPMRQTE